MLGGVVGRVSSNLPPATSCRRRCRSCGISPRLLPVDKLPVLTSSSPFSSCLLSSSPSASVAGSAQQQQQLKKTTSRSRAHIRLTQGCPSSSSLLFFHKPAASSVHSSTISKTLLSSASASSFSASLPSSCLPGGSLMSSRLAPAYSSSCGLTWLEGLIISSSSSSNCSGGSSITCRRHYRGPKGGLVRPSRNAKASVETRRISSGVSHCWCWRDGRGGAGGQKLRSTSDRSMDPEKAGIGIECRSSSSEASPGGGSDQPVSSYSSILPPLPANPAVSKVKGMAISFCPRCGGKTEERIPAGEHEKRYVCTVCGAVHYQNPKMVVGCLVEHEGKILLCRRNIEPSFGLWTLPAGYMEMGESAAEGAARETLEEACADVQVLGLFAHIDIPLRGEWRISYMSGAQAKIEYSASFIFFRAQMKDPHFAPGPESIECALFKLNEIPLDSLAFSSIQVALKMYIEDAEAGKTRVYHAVIDKSPGASPSDLKKFVVRDVLISEGCDL